MNNTPSHQQSSVDTSKSNTKTTSQQHMPPPPPRLPKRKQQELILEEDEWISKLEGIIERDFFPELGKLQDNVQWLEAIRSGDPESIRRAQLQIAQRRSATAAAFTPLYATPHSLTENQDGYKTYAANEDAFARPAAEIPTMSLDAFLAQHTSEDNASFQSILDRTNMRRRERAALLFSNNDDSIRKLITDGTTATALHHNRRHGCNNGDINDDSNQLPGANARITAQKGGEVSHHVLHHNKKQLVEYRINDGYGTTGQPTDSLTGWRYNPMNLFMYDGSTQESLPLSKKEFDSMAQGPPRLINHKATRLQNRDGTAIPATTTSVTDSGSADGAGQRFLHYDKKQKSDAKLERHPQHGGLDPSKYNILSTPSFDPGGDATPFMTWGDIGATPVRVDEVPDDVASTPAGSGSAIGIKKNGFAIQETPQREVMAHDLAMKASGSLRKRSQRGMPSMVQSLGGRVGGGALLSTAAQNLAGRLRRGGTVGSHHHARDMALRASYAGTPIRGGASSRDARGWESGAATPSHGSNWTPSGTLCNGCPADPG